MNGTLTATETWAGAEGTEGFVTATDGLGVQSNAIQASQFQTTNASNSLLLNGNTWTYPYYYGSYSYRIRLTLSEVNKLRAAAKRDKAIKDILKKFTNHIDLVVDFE